MRKHSARIAFDQESDRLWIARFIYSRGVYDRKNDEPARMDCQIELRGTNFVLVTQGGKPGGRRYRNFSAFNPARETGERWAARRFYTL